MKFDELDSRMRQFETGSDLCVLPEIYMVARIDGRSFTRLTKETQKFDAPFDARMRDLMTATTAHLMDSGFRIVYGYSQSDEISLLFHKDEDAFGRKLRKFISILAGEASAKFSLLLGDFGSFDCRICQLPTRQLVLDYFSWRAEDACRNGLNAHCYWMLRRAGYSAQDSTRRLEKLSVAEKNELLFQNGVNFNDVPAWQKRGTGLYWETYSKEAINPKTNESVSVQRRRIKTDLELPMREDYCAFVSQFV